MKNVDNSARILADDLSRSLRDFHRALIIAEAGGDTNLQNPYTFLFSVIGDPRFAWTAKLTQLIVRLDEMVAEDEVISHEHLQPFVKDVAQMLGQAAGGDAEFRLRHLMAIQKEPDVAMATGALRRVLGRLPEMSQAA